jgi:Domain of unknown function (DUF4430)
VRRLALLPLALVLAGCGLAVGSAPTAVQLLVTREFGERVLLRRGGLHAGEAHTVLDLLSATDAAHASSGGGFVSSIGGLSGGAGTRESGQATRWVLYVNGVQAPGRPGAASVHPGDHIWWDLHDVSQAPATPAAIVGAFPQPFLNGIEGKRLPVRVECTAVPGFACGAVAASLRRFGVPAAITAVGTGGAPETLRVIVGPWSRIGGDLEAQGIARGPRVSGVYAHFSAAGNALTLLDPEGQPVRTLGADAGLVAATQGPREAPVWIVTGTDDAGVELAARAFDRPTLADRFAVALEPSGASSLPVPGASVR